MNGYLSGVFTEISAVVRACFVSGFHAVPLHIDLSEAREMLDRSESVLQQARLGK